MVDKYKESINITVKRASKMVPGYQENDIIEENIS